MIDYYLIKIILYINFLFFCSGFILIVFIYTFLYFIKFKSKFSLKIRSDKLIFRIIINLILLSIFSYFLFVFDKSLNAKITFITITLATLGWLFSNYISSRNSIRQHTVTILTQLRMSTEFMKNANALQPYLEGQQIIDLKFYNSLESDKKIEKDAIRYILNYLEFVSAGIRYGDLDENLVKAAQRGMFIGAFEMCKPYITELNLKNKSTFEHLIAVAERWRL